MRSRILFVDDEPSIRQTLPLILEQHGFYVTAAATVPEALQAISAEKFDALIADLHIGEPGDGFTVVSAMRRTHPKCINLILTGYPAFETALQAIRNQVDDYLVKPADVQGLVDSIKEKLANPSSESRVHCLPLATFLREHEQEIVARTLRAMKSHPRLSRVRLTDRERTNHVPIIVHESAEQMESKTPDTPTETVLAAGVQHGEMRRKQGYTLPMLIDDARVLDSAIYDVVQNHLIRLDLSTLVPNLSRLNDVLEAQLQEAVQAFTKSEAA